MKTKKYIKLFVVFLLIYSVTGCRKENARWSSDWVVPLINDSLLIKDYVNDSTLAINSDQSIQVVLNRNLFNMDLSELIKISDTTITQSFFISVPYIQVTPGFAFIDETQESEFVIDNVVLLEAMIKQGKAKIRIENPVATKAIFTVSLLGVTKNGEEFQQTQIIDAGTPANPGINDIILDFSGYTIDMRGKEGKKYNMLKSKFIVKSDPDGPAITITNKDKFNISFSFENLTVNYAKGYFGNTVFSDTTVLEIDELNKITGGSINIDDVNLDLIIKNGIKANAQGNISLFKSINYNENAVELHHPYFDQVLNLDPAQGAWQSLSPSELTFSFNNSTSNLKNFLENLGNKYEVGYSIEINPYGNTSYGNDVVYPQSRIGIDLKADFPLKIGAEGLVIQDTFNVDFKNESKLLQAQSGKFILRTQNTFPYGAEVKLTLFDKDMNYIKELSSSGKITPAQMGVNEHLPMKDVVEFVIDEKTAESLSDIKFIFVRAEFNSTQLYNNAVYANAALKFILLAQLKLKASL